MKEYQDFILEVLAEASDIAGRNFGKVLGATKLDDNNQVLTDADIEIGNLIVKAIEQRYPAHNIIDEEAGVVDKASIYTWVVDPIDGTSNFASGVPTYGVMIGLLEGAVPIAGGIALPSFRQTYTAVKGNGAFRNGRPIHITSESSLLKTLVAYGIDGHQEDPMLTHDEAALLAKIILAIRNLRTSNSAYDFALVADGRYGAYLNRTSKIWDNVAPHIIIEEAGGLFTDFFGKPIDYSDPLSKVDHNFTACAASPRLHEQLQRIIRSA